VAANLPRPTVAADSADSMVCPYCAERISAQAVVCRHCQRDLQFFAPVQRELRAQARRIDALEAQNKRLAALIARHWSGLSAPELAATGAMATPPDAAPPGHAPAAPTEAQADAMNAAQTALHAPPAGLGTQPMAAFNWPAGLLRVALPVLALVAAHAAIVLALDLNQLWLRLASIVLPLALGCGFALRYRASLWAQAAFAVAIALLSVAAMAWVVARVDGVPFWPQNTLEWREIAYYAASIAFSDITGVLLARLAHHRRARSADRVAARLADIMAGAGATPSRTQAMRKQAETVRDVVTLLTPIVTAVISVVTGVVALFK
jgi:hypothetical protein